MMQLRQDDREGDWTVAGVYGVGAGVYRIPLPLPQDALRAGRLSRTGADGVVYYTRG